MNGFIHSILNFLISCSMFTVKCNRKIVKLQRFNHFKCQRTKNVLQINGCISFSETRFQLNENIQFFVQLKKITETNIFGHLITAFIFRSLTKNNFNAFRSEKQKKKTFMTIVHQHFFKSYFVFWTTQCYFSKWINWKRRKIFNMLSDLECTKIKGEKEMKNFDSWYFYFSFFNALTPCSKIFFHQTQNKQTNRTQNRCRIIKRPLRLQSGDRGKTPVPPNSKRKEIQMKTKKNCKYKHPKSDLLR